ncbi:hypothetical protein Gpo141_00013744, partial [Globisporangium polare]
MSEYTEEHTARAVDANNAPTFPTAYDEKDDMSALKAKLAARKKPIYAGLAFLAVVVIGVSIGVSTGSSTNASTGSGEANSDLTSSSAGATAAPAASTTGTGKVAGDADVQGSVIAGGAGSTWTQTTTTNSSSTSSASSSDSSAGADAAGLAS